MTSTRDPRASADQYVARAQHVRESAGRTLAGLPRWVAMDQEWGATSVEKTLAFSGSGLVADYSLGTDLVDLVPTVRSLGTVWTEAYAAVESKRSEPKWADVLGTLETKPAIALAAVELLSFAVVLHETEVIEQVLATPVIAAANDPVIGHLARLGGVDAAVDGALAYPKVWSGWIDVVTASGAEQQAAFERYVRDWAKTWRSARWLTKPSDSSYAGQWCFDAAPLAVCLALDDASVRDLPDYPADLVDHGRSIR